MSKILFFLDTCALLNLGNKIYDEPFKDNHICISTKTLEEIESIKTSKNKDDETKFKARVVTRILQTDTTIKVQPYDNHTLKYITNHLNMEVTPDNIIITTALALKNTNEYESVIFVSDDLNCNLIASRIFNLQTTTTLSDEEETEYKGYIEYHFKSDEELADFYANVDKNSLGLYVNQYALLYDKDNNLVDKIVWNGDKNKTVGYKYVDNDFMGKVKPRNIQQELAFNLLQNMDIPIKVLKGRFGSGKDFLMIANAIQFIKANKFNKLIWVRNNVEVKNTNPIGFLPNSLEDKLMPFCSPLADHLGGQSGLEMYMKQDKIEIQHLGFIRGRDIKNSIIYCSEAENMTTEHIQLLLGRVGEGSTLWLNGDFKQTDDKIFEKNNGFKKIIERLKGNKLFGVVQLDKTERSETAALADLLD